VTVDFFQQASYENYSDKTLLSELQRNTDEVKSRAEKLISISEQKLSDLETQIEKINQPTNEAIFQALSEHMPVNSLWAVYSRDGSLIAWNGQVDAKETFLAEGSEDVSVESEMHQQFFKLRKAIPFETGSLILTVWTPIAADYGIENRYLSSYNLLTDN